MDILCLMGLFPKEYEKEILKDSIVGIQNAANKFQWGIVNGLDGIENIHFRIINSLYIGSYPKRYHKLRIPHFKFSHSKGANDLNIGFINLTILKTVSRYFGIKKEIDKWALDNNNEQKIIIAYAMTSPFLEILNYIKKRYPNIICCLVVPDLPEYMNVSLSENRIYKILKNIQIKHFKNMLRKVDCYVFLTEYMKEWFNWDIKYTVIEGISSKTKEDIEPKKEFIKKKSILYAGMIEKKYGVLDLVKAFMKIENKDWNLELFGTGSILEEIRKLAEKDLRIHIHGMVSNDQVLEEQKKVELLINPRNDKQEFTKYSFPSKVIEYMGSGTPMIGYKLSGMPKEYTSNFYCVDSNEEDGLYNTIKKVINLTSKERKELGKKAQEFIINEKTAVIQCKKIISLLKEVYEENNLNIGEK